MCLNFGDSKIINMYENYVLLIIEKNIWNCLREPVRNCATNEHQQRNAICDHDNRHSTTTSLATWSMLPHKSNIEHLGSGHKVRYCCLEKCWRFFEKNRFFTSIAENYACRLICVLCNLIFVLYQLESYLKFLFLSKN